MNVSGKGILSVNKSVRIRKEVIDVLVILVTDCVTIPILVRVSKVSVGYTKQCLQQLIM